MEFTIWRHTAIQVGVLVALFGCSLSTECPDTWTVFQGSCYMFGADTLRNFSESEHFCHQHGGHLVHVDNMAENDFIKDVLKHLKPALYWMGLTDARNEGVWTWHGTNTSPSFTDWSPGQPDNAHKNEDCVNFLTGNHFDWNDDKCTNLHKPLCELRKANSEAVVG